MDMRIFTCMKMRENSFTRLILGPATRCTGLSSMMSRMHGLFVGKYFGGPCSTCFKRIHNLVELIYTQTRAEIDLE
jgi:hypothetical protein